jgi:hypothetical protein
MKTSNKKTGFHSISLEIEKEEVRVRWHHVARAAWKSPGIYSVYLLLATLGLAGLGGAIEGICTGSIDFALIRSRGNRDVVLPIVKDGRESVFWAAVLSSAILGAALAGLSVRDMFFYLPRRCAQREQWFDRQRRLREEDRREHERKFQKMLELKKQKERRLEKVHHNGEGVSGRENKDSGK